MESENIPEGVSRDHKAHTFLTNIFVTLGAVLKMQGAHSLFLQKVIKESRLLPDPQQMTGNLSQSVCPQ